MIPAAKLFAPVAFVVLLPVGCSTVASLSGPVDATGSVASPSAALTAMIGSDLAGRLDDSDIRLAYQAQIKALSDGRAGAPVAWRNPKNGRSGEVVPGSAYEVNAIACRDFGHTVMVDGAARSVRGTACRNGAGPWQPVS